jgi:AcrR family transcriptional regulator
VSESRPYVSPKREAQAAATRSAILDAFVEQLSDPGRHTLSPSEAAVRAGVSVRTVHLYFPNLESQVAALSEWFDQHLNPAGITPAAGPADLPRYFREIHANALASPLSRALATSSGEVWQTVRRTRRAKRLDAIRAAVEGVGAPAQATAEATAMVLRLSGADASWPLHDSWSPSASYPRQTESFFCRGCRRAASGKPEADHQPPIQPHPCPGGRDRVQPGR